MERLAPALAALADVSDLARGTAVAVVTLVVLLTALVAVGFVMLFRRRGDRGIRPTGATSLDALGKRSASLLVRLDDALREADDELGYAIAQFGPERARSYADALAGARAKVAEAFRLRQQLDDAYADTERERREWTLQIIALCEQAEASLGAQDAAFGDLRKREVNAAGTLRDVRSRIADTRDRLGAARSTLAELEQRYPPAVLAPVLANPDSAEKLLAGAVSQADAAEPGISQSGVSAPETAHSAHRADQLLDAVDRTARDLAAADDALATLRRETAADLVEAKAERDSAPDADTGEAIIRAIAAVESILAENADGPSDPVAHLDRLGDAVNGLDLALASARNQAQRLEHARTAYAGTLVSARSQIAAAREYIAGHGVGVDARTRLAEAERQLALAQAETDPVEALDTVRRAVTHARDADALARFDTMGGG